MTKPPLIRPWTDDDIQKLIAGVDAGMSKFRVAAMLGRTPTGVKERARMVGKPFKSIYEARRELKDREAAALRKLET